MIYILAEEFIKQPSPLTATEQYLWNALFIGIIIEINYQNVPDVIKFSENNLTVNIAKLETS